MKEGREELEPVNMLLLLFLLISKACIYIYWGDGILDSSSTLNETFNHHTVYHIISLQQI